MEPTYPLDVFWCERCSLVQIDEIERAEHIFDEDYAYFSSYSDSWLAHCRRYVEMTVARFALSRSSFVVEAASNDGYLLQYFAKYGVPVLGVEPARSVASAAIAKGVATDIVFFTEDYGKGLREHGRQADLLIANNVLAHNPNVHDFIAGIAAALAPTGVATLEFPHVLRMIEDNQFDTIYHEHFSYLSLHAVEAMFEAHGMQVFDLEELPTHGGSLRIFVQPSATARHPVNARVGELRDREVEHGLLRRDTYARFAQRVTETKHALLTLLINAKRAGHRIVGYGAPAKGNTLLNFCGVRTDFLDYTVDRSPHKQGRYLPGTRVPIYAPERLLADRPDYVLILPWNLKDEIMSQLAEVRARGCRFIVPIPVPMVVQ
jgi:SAM-dependent methyltransferase